MLHARRPELAEAITDERREPRLPAGHPAARRRCGRPPTRPRRCEGAEIVVLAVPVADAAREPRPSWAPLLPPDATLLSLMKGIELGTTKRMSEVICEVTGAGPERVAVVSGPNLAREIAEEQPAATVIACTDADRAGRCRRPATRRTSGRTPTPTWSAASSAAR